MRHRNETDRRLETALANVAQSCRAGETLSAALRSANDRQPTRIITRILERHDSGATLRVACESINNEDSLPPDESLVLHVIGLAAEVGGPAEQHFEALLHTLADRRNALADRMVQASTARASIRVMTAVPVLVGCWLAYDDERIRRVMFHTTAGLACLVIGVLLNVLGRAWAGALVRAS